jgi:hypothetical protein
MMTEAFAGQAATTETMAMASGADNDSSNTYIGVNDG